MKTNTYERPSLMPAAHAQVPPAPFVASVWPIQMIMGHRSAQLELIKALQGSDANGFTTKSTNRVKTTVSDVRGVPPRGRPV
jgi:hypothetical protein